MWASVMFLVGICLGISIARIAQRHVDKAQCLASAWHEAGHAVVALALGWEVQVILVWHKGGGFVLTPSDRHHLIAAGGMAVDAIRTGRQDFENDGGARDDIETLSAGGWDYEQEVRKAETILRARWADVEKIVDGLMRHCGKLTCEDLAAMGLHPCPLQRRG